MEGHAQMGIKRADNVEAEILIAPERPVAHFVGRKMEREELAALLTSSESAGIVALQGMGGIGKTALALQLANDLKLKFPGGMLWARLGQHPDLYGILGRWAEAAGGDLDNSTDLVIRAETVRTLLARRRRILVILDDVWDHYGAHLLIQQALPANTMVLLTTRRVDTAKQLGCQVKKISVLSEEESLTLIAKLVDPLGSYEQVGRQVAKQVGYLPLALRIVAGIADRPSDLENIVHQLQTKPILDLLTLKPGDCEKSVEASLVLSYNELDAEMQWRFRALGAFAAAPFDMDAVAEIWGEAVDGVATEQVHNALQFLERRGLLTRHEGGLCTQHDLLRLYALKLLTQKGEAAVMRSKHATYYRTLAKSSDWRTTEAMFEQVHHGWEHVKERGVDVYDYFKAANQFLERRRWLQCQEWGRTALDWVRASDNSKAEGELLCAMGYTEWWEGHYIEALDHLRAGVSKARKIKDPELEGLCLNRIGLVHRDQGRYTDALNYFRDSVVIQQEIDDELGKGYAFHNIGLTFFYLSEWNTALEQLKISKGIFETLLGGTVSVLDQEDRVLALQGKALVLKAMGRVYSAIQQFQESMDLLQRSLILSQEMGDISGEGRTLSRVGQALLIQGKLDQALSCFEQAIDIARASNQRRSIYLPLRGIGQVMHLRSHNQEILDYCQPVLYYYQQIGDLREEAIVLSCIGRTLLAQGEYEQALEWFQRSLDIAQEIGARFGVAVVLNNMGAVHEKIGNLVEAKCAQERAAAISEELDIRIDGNIWQWID
jgi:tetratricopeptide (TPR) repeat protein